MTHGLSDPLWYVIHTKPKQETRAESNLRAWGVETLLPRLREGRHDGTRHISPLFPRYLFARFDADRLLLKVRLTRGVHAVVGFGGQATPVGEDVIALVHERIQDDGYVRLAGPQPGELVQVAEGPLRSLVGVFEREMDGRARAMVLLTTVGCQARIHVAKAFIRSIPTAAAV